LVKEPRQPNFVSVQTDPPKAGRCYSKHTAIERKKENERCLTNTASLTRKWTVMADRNGKRIIHN
jgi:hypothetical protein